MLILYYILFFNKFLDFIDSCLSCIQFSRCILSFLKDCILQNQTAKIFSTYTP